MAMLNSSQMSAGLQRLLALRNCELFTECEQHCEQHHNYRITVVRAHNLVNDCTHLQMMLCLLLSVCIRGVPAFTEYS